MAMTVIRLGLIRDLRKIYRDFSRAMARSTGALAWASARLTVRWVGVTSPPGGGQVVGAARHGRRDPQHVAGRIGDDLDVHAVPTVLCGVVGAAVADAVVLGGNPVPEDVSHSTSAWGRPSAAGYGTNRASVPVS